MALDILAIVMGIIVLVASIWAWRMDNGGRKKTEEDVNK